MLCVDGNNVEERDKLMMWGERGELLVDGFEKIVEGIDLS